MMTVSDVQRVEGFWLKLAAIIFAAGVAYNRLDSIDARLVKVEARVERLTDYFLPQSKGNALAPRLPHEFGALEI